MKIRPCPVVVFVLGVALGPLLWPALAAETGEDQQQTEDSKSRATNTEADDLIEELSRLIAAVGGEPLLDEARFNRITGSPCGRSLVYLVSEYVFNPAVPPALDAVVAGLKDLPPGYPANPWKAATNGRELLLLMIDDFTEWCVFLPEIDGSEDNGLYHIQRFAWLYFHNHAGRDFVQGRNPLTGEPLEVGLQFLEDFSAQRGAFMWSPGSRARIEQWLKDPRIEIADYQKQQASEYGSWNEFFAREIIVDEESQTIPSRPATMPLSEYPQRDYIVVSPTDCIMNPLVQVLVEDAKVVRRLIENPLQRDTVLDVKGIPISLDRLLGNLDPKHKANFVGGTGLSCVLMPNTYHHFHAPVNGTVIHAELLTKEGTFGYFDWPNWVPLDGNVGRPGTDFSQFEAFERGVIVIEVKYADVDGKELTGYVASIPVGLDTIGSVVLDKGIEKGKVVKRGYTRLGNFYYGGSLDILLFSKGLATGAVQTRLGNQITLFNIGTTPPGGEHAP